VGGEGVTFWDWADRHWLLVGIVAIGLMVIVYDHFPVIRFTWTKKQ
jgi:hypothetical protein